MLPLTWKTGWCGGVCWHGSKRLHGSWHGRISFSGCWRRCCLRVMKQQVTRRWRGRVNYFVWWITSRCWLWWVCGWLWLVVCDAGLVAEAEGLLWRCRWSMSEVVNRRGSVGWCNGLLGGGGSTAVIGWGAADGCRWWWTVTLDFGGCLLVEKMNSVSPFFFSIRTVGLLLHSEQGTIFFLDQTGSRVKHKHCGSFNCKNN